MRASWTGGLRIPAGVLRINAMLCSDIIIDAICLTQHDQDQDQPSGRCSPDQNATYVQKVDRMGAPSNGLGGLARLGSAGEAT